MNAATRNYPVGDMRVCDADRDRALRELSEAFEAGRIDAAEFDQRSGQALGARTGKELTALLADLPHGRAGADTAGQRPACRKRAARIAVVISAAGAAIPLAAIAVANALSHPGRDHANRKLAEEILARMGLKVAIPAPPPAPGFDWVGTVTPGAIAVVLFVLIVCLFLGRPGRRSRGTCR